jgi:hypothetical protein
MCWWLSNVCWPPRYIYCNTLYIAVRRKAQHVNPLTSLSISVVSRSRRVLQDNEPRMDIRTVPVRALSLSLTLCLLGERRPLASK